jgi:hypothetical protein
MTKAVRILDVEALSEIVLRCSEYSDKVKKAQCCREIFNNVEGLQACLLSGIMLC